MDFEEMGTIEECRVKMLLVVDALKANCPISDMTVELDGESILLQDFLLDVPRITEVDAHFRGWPLFNIYSSLPDGLKKFPEKMNIDGFDAQKLLKRFELYTWRAKSHLMEAYFQTLKHVRRVSTAKLPFDANPNLSRTLENFLRGLNLKIGLLLMMVFTGQIVMSMTALPRLTY